MHGRGAISGLLVGSLLTIRRSLLSVPAAIVALIAAAALPVSAQDTSHPAGIYVGSCPVQGNLLVSLWDVSPSFLVDGEANAGATVGTQAGFPVVGSVTIVESALSELVASEHAIIVHRSQSEMDDHLVCGDIGGVMVGPDELPVALAPVGLSPWSGIALLDADGRGTTTVTVSLFEGPGIDTGADGTPLEPFPAPARSPEDFGADAGDVAQATREPDELDSDRPGDDDDDSDGGGNSGDDDSGGGGDDD